MPALLDLPNECLLNIMGYLQPDELALLSALVGNGHLEGSPCKEPSRNIINLSSTCRHLWTLATDFRIYNYAFYTEQVKSRPTAFAAAARRGDFKLVRMLLSRTRGNYFNPICSYGSNYDPDAYWAYDPDLCALAAAIVANDRQMFDLLIDREHKVALDRFFSYMPYLGEEYVGTAIELAARSGSMELFKFILSLSSPDILEWEFVLSPVNGAVGSGNVELLKTILELGVYRQTDYESQDDHKSPNPFCDLKNEHMACAEEMIKVLLAEGYDINQTCSKLCLRLDESVYPQADEPCEEYDVSPLLYHCCAGSCATIIKLLVQNGADPNTQMRNDGYYIWDPLKCAVKMGDCELLQFLLDNGAVPGDEG